MSGTLFKNWEAIHTVATFAIVVFGVLGFCIVGLLEDVKETVIKKLM